MKPRFSLSGFRNDFDIQFAIAENHHNFWLDITGVLAIVAANVIVDFT